MKSWNAKPKREQIEIDTYRDYDTRRTIREKCYVKKFWKKQSVCEVRNNTAVRVIKGKDDRRTYGEECLVGNTKDLEFFEINYDEWKRFPPSIPTFISFSGSPNGFQFDHFLSFEIFSALDTHHHYNIGLYLVSPDQQYIMTRTQNH